jgi:perosamine synthetase
MTEIPITKPFFDKSEREAVLKPLDAGWLVQGPFVQEFEQKFSAFTRSHFSVATTSCTTALHLAVIALGLKSGDEVIVPAFTWISTANVVEYVGARPVFCDIDLRTFNIDPEQVNSLITDRTVGIIPVHLFGLCADMDAIMAIAKKRSLWVVEDAACGFGAHYRGKHAGTIGDLGCFSFHPRKSITTGEGGMVTTQQPHFDAMARSLRDHGASRSDFQRHAHEAAFLLPDYDHLGFNYRMTDLQGALGCAQIEKAPWILAERSRRARLFDEALKGLDWLQRPIVPDGCEHAYQAYVCLFRPEEPLPGKISRLHEKRNRLMAALEAKGIATRQGTHAPVSTGYYAKKYGIRPEQFSNAWAADRLSLTLPLYVQMTDAEQERVVDELKRIGKSL